jgi:hypothetical protein
MGAIRRRHRRRDFHRITQSFEADRLEQLALSYCFFDSIIIALSPARHSVPSPDHPSRANRVAVVNSGVSGFDDMLNVSQFPSQGDGCTLSFAMQLSAVSEQRGRPPAQ